MGVKNDLEWEKLVQEIEDLENTPYSESSDYGDFDFSVYKDDDDEY